VIRKIARFNNPPTRSSRYYKKNTLTYEEISKENSDQLYKLPDRKSLETCLEDKPFVIGC